jgi:hypothetical protein
MRLSLTIYTAVMICCCIVMNRATAATADMPCRIVDKRTLIPIPGAQVCIEQLNVCVESDSSGEALCSHISPGSYSLTAGANGYDTLFLENILIKTGLNAPLTIEIQKSMQVFELDRMVIQSPCIAKEPDQSTSMTRLSPYELANTAGTGNDVSRVLSTLPSVISSSGDMKNTLYVRGGHSRENSFVIDGMEFDNISHFADASSGGGMGFVNGSVVSGLNFYAGGIPALYPPAISSIIDMQIREGSFIRPHYQAELSIVGIGLVAEGPIWKNHISFLLSMRYLNLKFIDRFLPLNGVPQFGDGLLKLAYRPNGVHTVSLLGIGVSDKYQVFDNRYNWGHSSNSTDLKKQGAVGLAWQMTTTQFRNRLLGSFRLTDYNYSDELAHFDDPTTLGEYYWVLNTAALNATSPRPPDSLLMYRALASRPEIYGNLDQRWHVTLQDDFVFYLRDNDQVSIGVRGKISSYHLGQRSSILEQRTTYWFPDSTDSSHVEHWTFTDTPYVADSVVKDASAGGYLQYVFNQGPFKIIGGTRIDYFRLLRDYGISPRCAVVCNSGSAGIFSLSGGLFYQSPADLNARLYDIMTANPNSNLPKPQFEEIELQRNWQAVLGYERELPGSRAIKAEAYYKWYDREYELIRPDYLVSNKEIEAAAENHIPLHLSPPRGKKKVYGLEILLQKHRQEGFFYTIGYSVFTLKNRYADGIWYNDVNSLQNSLGLTMGAQFNKNHEFSLRLSAGQGRPYCKITHREVYSYDTTAVYFSQRLEPTFTVNVRYSFNLFPRWGTITGYVEAWNLFNYTPVIERVITPWEGYRDFLPNGIIPMVGISIEF